MADLCKEINMVGVDTGHVNGNAISARVFNQNGKVVQRNILQLNKTMQKPLKLHARNVQRLRDKFVIDLQWLKRSSDAGGPVPKAAFVASACNILHQTSWSVRNEAWLLRQRRKEQYDRFAAQVLEATGALARSDHENAQGTASNLSQPDRQIVFAIGADCGPAKGIKTHSADFRNGLLREIIALAGWLSLLVVFLLVKEDFSSQVCPRLDCLKPPNGDESTGEGDEDSGSAGEVDTSGWIRSK